MIECGLGLDWGQSKEAKKQTDTMEENPFGVFFKAHSFIETVLSSHSLWQNQHDLMRKPNYFRFKT